MAEQTKEPRLKNKVVIVTGGVQGIGRGIVDVLDEQGATVVVLDIQDEVGAAMKSTGGGEIIYMHCDMTKEEEIKNTIEEIVKRLGRIDCLVNNVGGYQGTNKIDDLSVESFKEILQLDLLSTFIASKYSLPHLRKTKGSIVNISSCGQHTGFKNGCTYIASKGGVSGLTIALAVDEAEHGVRVNSFQDKVVIVTGGCSGIGKGCVDVFLENGGKVAVFDINEDVGINMTTDGPGEVIFVKCDVRVEENVKSAINAVMEKFGHIDCLINNAGFHPGSKDIDEMSIAEFEGIIKLNLTSYFAMCKYSLPHLRQVKGSIVNISSMSGVIGDPMCPSYCTSKAGVAGLTRALAIDEALSGVRVNAIAPAGIWTPLCQSIMNIQDSPQRWYDLNCSTTQLNRFGEPREIGLAAVFLAVDATFTTGTELNCSGGSEIGYGVKGHELV